MALLCMLTRVLLLLSTSSDAQGSGATHRYQHVVIISDRDIATRVTVGSILSNTRSNVIIWIISAKADIVQRACSNLSRLENQHIKVLDFEQVNRDLIVSGVHPLWTWREYGTSIAEGSKWLSKSSVRVGSWDYNLMHSHRMNMLRFYLPEIPLLRSVDSCYFMDDDVILRHDIARLRKIKAHPGVVQIGTCATFTYNESRCAFSPKLRASLREYSGLYLNVEDCSAKRTDNCKPHSYEEDLQRLRQSFSTRLDFDRSPIWNYGFAAINFAEWRRLNMTKAFETMMKGVYKMRLFPETSLAYGLGVAFLLLGGYVQCWEALNVTIFDGAGYLTEWDMVGSGLPAIAEETFAVHWSGNDKPWATSSDSGSWLRSSYRAHWAKAARRTGLQLPQVDPRPAVRVVLLTDKFLDAKWFTRLLDEHPQICAPSESSSDRFAFSDESMAPPMHPKAHRGCAPSKLCTWDAIQKNVPPFVKNFQHRCNLKNRIVDPSPWIYCKWAARVKNMSHLKKMYVNAIFGSGPAKTDLACNCPANKHIRVFTVMEDWIISAQKSFRPKDKLSYGNNLFDDYQYKFPWESVKVLSFIKHSPLRSLVRIARHRKAEAFTVDTDKLVADLKTWVRRDYNFLGDNRPLTMLELDYDTCVENPISCLRRAVRFLGADEQLFSKKANSSMVGYGMQKRSGYVSILHEVANKQELLQSLRSNGLSSYADATINRKSKTKEKGPWNNATINRKSKTKENGPWNNATINRKSKTKEEGPWNK